MAKSKKSGKKPKSAKPVVKEEKVAEEITEKTSDEIVEEDVKTSEKELEKEEKDDKVEAKEVEAEVVEKKEEAKAETEKKCDKSKCSFCKKFFAKKYEGEESILTIFRDKKIYGALLGEVFGTMLIALVIFTLGMTQPLYLFFLFLAIIIAVYKLSGAQLNPINTVGMMATRRMSVIRGVLYLLSQVVGVWFGYLIVKAFLGVSASVVGSEMQFPAMAVINEGFYWVVTFLEFLGAILVGFFYARAQAYKCKTVAFAATVAGGFTLSVVVVYLLSYSYFGLSGNFMMNPAVSLLYGILPQSADGIGQLLIGIGQALFTYVLFPIVGGVIGFFLSDIAGTFMCDCCCEKKQ